MPNARTRSAANKSATTPSQPANAPVSPARGLGLDFESLAASAQPVAELPKATREGNAKNSALKDLVVRSHAEGKAFALPAIPVEGDVDKFKQSMGSAIRRAASQAGLGVSIRYEFNADGNAVVTIQGRDKK